MRYKDYVWPHNPRVYTIEYKRTMGARKVPFGRYHLQDLGPAQRVMRGEGEFVGEGAYGEEAGYRVLRRGTGAADSPGLADLQRLLCGALTPAGAQGGLCGVFLCFLGGIRRTQHRRTGDRGRRRTGDRPGRRYGGERRHTVRRGETLWGIARDYSLSLTELIALNPQIKNPNLILAGEEVRLA